MSARAACRLETLGFSKVYRYTGGKTDWAASGRPMEGHGSEIASVKQAMRRNPPTCGLHERIGDIRDRVGKAGWDTCIVVDGRVVLGRLRSRALSRPDETTAEDAMESGPTTTRPDDLADMVLPRLREADVEQIVVTTPDGELLGILYRKDGECCAETEEGDRSCECRH